MKTTILKPIFTILLLAIFSSAFAFQGKIAVIADGNSPDPDDIGATSASLAMLKIFNREKDLVHYTHSCDLSGMKDREGMMARSLFGTAKEWGGFIKKDFFNFNNQRDAARKHLAAQINKASKKSLLYVINAGETDLLYEALVRAKKGKRKFVRYITHHVANDVGDFHDLTDILRISGVPSRKVFVQRIKDQNTNLKKPINNMYWARNHDSNKVREIWKHVKKGETEWPDFKSIKNKADISDAGMLWYLLTDFKDQNCTFKKFENKVKSYLRKTRKGKKENKTVVFDERQLISSLTISPNPAADVFKISLQGFDKAKVMIYDLLGKLVYKKVAVNGVVEISRGTDFTSGMYFVKVFGEGNQNSVSKILIMK